MREGRLWIDGRWRDGAGWADGIDPRTGQVAYRWAVGDAAAVAEAVEAARRAQPGWAASPWRRRREVLVRALQVTLDRLDDIAGTVMLETGKPPCECVGGAEIPVVLELLAYYAHRTPEVLADRAVRIPPRPYFWGKRGWVRRVPLGVVGAITPWNVPLSLTMGLVVPALAAGCAVVIKPSEYAPLTALEVARIFHEAGLPRGLLNVVPGGPDAGRVLVDSDVDRIAFIGSTPTGQAIALRLAQLGRRPPLLELSGKDAMIVCRDADVAYAAQGAVWAGFNNAGQLCCSVERVYVAREVADRFIDEVLRAASRLSAAAGLTAASGPGAPASPGGGDLPPHWTFGPLISEAAWQRVHRHVTEAVERGAHLACGGFLPDRPGWWYPPTVLTGVTEDMTVMKEETFGPVLPIAVVDSEEEALERARSSPFGLTGSVWTEDLERGRRLAAAMGAGLVTVNDHASPYGIIDSPWGGVRASGYGRTHGAEALLEFTEVQALVVDRDPTRKVWWYPYTRPAYDYFRWGNVLLFDRSWRRRLAALPRVLRSLLEGRRGAGLGSDGGSGAGLPAGVGCGDAGRGEAGRGEARRRGP